MVKIKNCWIEVAKDSDFSIYNIPFGIFSTPTKSKRVGIAIGSQVLDLVALSELGVFDFDTSVFNKNTLNDFISLGKPITNKVRTSIQDWISDHNSPISNKRKLIYEELLSLAVDDEIGDYTDFYSIMSMQLILGQCLETPKMHFFQTGNIFL